MYVLLDTNIYVGDWRLSGSAFNVFREARARIGANWVVPEIIFAEVTNKAAERVSTIKDRLESIATELQFVRGRPTERIALDAMATSADYSAFLTDLFAKEDAKIIPMPGVPHAELAQRAVEKRRPFKESGAGYRDALIWHTILELLRDPNTKLCFVTANSSDFGKSVLHHDLVSDLTQRSIDPGRIRYFNTLEAFNEAVVLPTLEQVDGLAKELEAGSAALDIMAWARLEFRGLLEARDVAYVALDWAYECGRVRMGPIRHVTNLRVAEVRRLPSGRFFIRASVDASIELNLSARDEDFERYQAPRELFSGMEDDAGMVYDVSADYPVDIEVTFTLVVEPDASGPESASIVEISGDHGSMTI